ncbi:MAG: hypothetical protein PHI13_11685 [Methylococcales bacterium]|nr:hypothetical protein [Methylococcales bacterium]
MIGDKTGLKPVSMRSLRFQVQRKSICQAMPSRARITLDEDLGFRPDFVEHQLAHAVIDPNERAYIRAAHLAERY